MLAEPRPGAATQLLGAHGRDVHEKEPVVMSGAVTSGRGASSSGGLLVGRLEFFSHKQRIVPKERGF